MACWGSSSNNQNRPTSADGVYDNTRFLALSAAGGPSDRHGTAGHTCAIRADNTMACWGSGVADSRTDPTSSPQGVDANTRFLAVSAGGRHTCAIKADNTAACWGFDDDSRTDPASAAGVDANTRFLALSAGGYFSGGHTCGIKADNTAVCWGNPDNGRTNPTSSPQGVDANTRFLALSAGRSHTCAIKADNTAACWGDRAYNLTHPAGAAGINANTRFLALSAGAFHNCGIKTDGAAACWGFDGNRQASPPSDSFNRTPDVFWLAERTEPLTTEDGGKPVQLNELTEVEPLHFSLTLNEGETTTLALFR